MSRRGVNAVTFLFGYIDAKTKFGFLLNGLIESLGEISDGRRHAPGKDGFPFEGIASG